MSTDDAKLRYHAARRVTLVGAVINALLSIFKILFGWLGHSTALVADGIHSLSDLVTDFLILFAAKAGSQAPDEDHPYGHERIETFATVALAVFLITVGIGIAVEAANEIISGDYGQLPGISVIIVAAISIVANEFLFHYTLHTAKKINSDLLRANAWHSRSDALSSLVVLIGAIGTLLGIHFMDSLAAVIVAILIVKMGVKMAWRSVLELIDTGIDEEKKLEILSTLKQTPGVRAVHEMRSRSMGGNFFIDVHLQVDPYLSVSEGHFIADQAHKKLRHNFAEIKDVTIHIDPENDETSKPCSHLPTRKDLLIELNKRWQNLPGWQNLIALRLDYLAGSLYISPVLPLSLLKNDLTAEILQQQYQKSISDIDYIAEVTLNFRLGK